MKKRISKISAPIMIASIIMIGFLVLVAQAQFGEVKPYLEGQGAEATGRTEGQSPQSLKPGEGLTGQSGSARVDEVGESLVAAGMSTLYRFSGATDDGEQGSGNRKEATSVLCTNIDSTQNAQVEVQIFQWNGTDVFTGTVNMPPNNSFTFSTQNTEIYFEDVIIGGNLGTPAIFQGSGRILSSHANVICTVEVLDPLNYPPIFMDKLTLYNPDGSIVGDSRSLYLPLIRK